MRARANAIAGSSRPSSCCAQTALGLLRTVEAPLAIAAAHKPFVILGLGVNGTGKTTTVGKLAHRLEGQGPLGAARGRRHVPRGRRRAAPGVGRARATCRSSRRTPGADPAAVVHDALVAARARGVDVVLADTAGRLHTAAGLMDELEKIKRVIQRFDATAPHEILLVLDASQGQNALAQALKFHERLGVTGLAITKLDGTAKGGILLAIARQLEVPIRFVARRRRRRRPRRVSRRASSCARCSATRRHDSVRERPQALPDAAARRSRACRSTSSAASSCS